MAKWKFDDYMFDDDRIAIANATTMESCLFSSRYSPDLIAKMLFQLLFKVNICDIFIRIGYMDPNCVNDQKIADLIQEIEKSELLCSIKQNVNNHVELLSNGIYKPKNKSIFGKLKNSVTEWIKRYQKDKKNLRNNTLYNGYLCIDYMVRFFKLLETCFDKHGKFKPSVEDCKSLFETHAKFELYFERYNESVKRANGANKTNTNKDCIRKIAIKEGVYRENPTNDDARIVRQKFEKRYGKSNRKQLKSIKTIIKKHKK